MEKEEGSIPELSPAEIRIIGALLEKEVLTPEIYPMSVNGLTTASNQKTNRDPVMQLDEEAIQSCLEELRAHHLVMRVDVAGSRVPKFKQTLSEAWELKDAERAILTILFLRGAQTIGQIRQRTERIYSFRSLEVVEEKLLSMMERVVEPFHLVKELPRAPGTKDVRFTHVLDNSTHEAQQIEETANVGALFSKPNTQSRVDALESEVSELKQRLDRLETAFSDLMSELK